MRTGGLGVGHRALALLVAGALFMELLDGTVIATAAPRMARTFGVQSADIGIAITAYLLTVAVLIPLSGWLSDRLGARLVFTSAIVIFTVSSAVCAVSSSLLELTLLRVLQGIGGAMMVPVGRQVVMRSTAKDEVIAAVAFLTWPALFAPVVAPVIGGVLTTYASWRWIFLINLPLGLVGIVLAIRLVPDLRAPDRRRLDGFGLVTSTLGLGTFVYGVSLVDGHRLPVVALSVTLVVSIALLAVAVRHLWRAPDPLVDLKALTIETFRVSQLGGTFYRTAILAVPFLLPLMFQDDFGWSAARAGGAVVFVFVGNLCIKPATTPLLRRFGFRLVLLASIVVGALATAACGLLHASTPVVVVGALLIVGGAFRSIGFTAYNTIAYADIDPDDMVHANTLTSTIQQLAGGLAVAAGALALRLGEQLRGPFGQSGSVHFPYLIAFVAVAVLLIPAMIEVLRLPRAAGAAIGGGVGRRANIGGADNDGTSMRNTQ